MSRTFYVQQDKTAYYTVTWEVEADSFAEAEDMVDRGLGDFYDEDEYDSDYGSIDEVRCSECDSTDPDDCECESADLFEEIGL